MFTRGVLLVVAIFMVTGLTTIEQAEALDMDCSALNYNACLQGAVYSACAEECDETFYRYSGTSHLLNPVIE